MDIINELSSRANASLYVKSKILAYEKYLPKNVFFIICLKILILKKSLLKKYFNTKKLYFLSYKDVRLEREM